MVASTGEGMGVVWRGLGVLLHEVQAGSRKKKEIYSLAKVHAIFSIQTVKLCTRLPCAIAKASLTCRLLLLFFG